jgi:hypothetical protein
MLEWTSPLPETQKLVATLSPTLSFQEESNYSDEGTKKIKFFHIMLFIWRYCKKLTQWPLIMKWALAQYNQLHQQ